MSVFTLNSTQAGWPVRSSERIGVEHVWALSVCEFDTDGGYDVHVTFTGCWQRAGLQPQPGYWCNLSGDQSERIIQAVRDFKFSERATPTAYGTASAIMDIVLEEPDIEIFTARLIEDTTDTATVRSAPSCQSGPVAVHPPASVTQLGAK